MEDFLVRGSRLFVVSVSLLFITMFINCKIKIGSNIDEKKAENICQHFNQLELISHIQYFIIFLPTINDQQQCSEIKKKAKVLFGKYFADRLITIQSLKLSFGNHQTYHSPNIHLEAFASINVRKLEIEVESRFSWLPFKNIHSVQGKIGNLRFESMLKTFLNSSLNYLKVSKVLVPSSSPDGDCLNHN